MSCVTTSALSRSLTSGSNMRGWALQPGQKARPLLKMYMKHHLLDHGDVKKNQ